MIEDYKKLYLEELINKAKSMRVIAWFYLFLGVAVVLYLLISKIIINNLLLILSILAIPYGIWKIVQFSKEIKRLKLDYKYSENGDIILNLNKGIREV